MAREKISGIYCIENVVNNKKYIGLSCNIYKRWSDHRYRLNKGIHENIYLQRAWNKYGSTSFTFTIIEKVPKENLSDKEIFYINLFNTTDFNNGYNSSSGGENGVVCEDALIRRSISLTKNHVIQFDLKGNEISRFLNANKAGKETGLNENDIYLCCQKSYGRKTLGGYIWMFEADYDNNGINLDDYNKCKSSKQVVQYTKSGDYIASYESARKVEDVTGISHKQISQACLGNKKVVHGFVWRFNGDSFNKFDVQNKKFIKVSKYDLDGNYICTYSSVSEANRENNCKIQHALTGRCKTCAGYIWKVA